MSCVVQRVGNSRGVNVPQLAAVVSDFDSAVGAHSAVRASVGGDSNGRIRTSGTRIALSLEP